MTTFSSAPPRAAAEAALPMLLRQLKLAWIRSHWQSLSARAEAEGWSHSQFLFALCEQETEQRQQSRQQRLDQAATRQIKKK
jgi:DNA replication protein DnaC